MPLLIAAFCGVPASNPAPMIPSAGSVANLFNVSLAVITPSAVVWLEPKIAIVSAFDMILFASVAAKSTVV